MPFAPKLFQCVRRKTKKTHACIMIVIKFCILTHRKKSYFYTILNDIHTWLFSYQTRKYYKNGFMDKYLQL